MEDGGHFIQSMYLVMALLGMDPDDIVPNYDDGDGNTLTIAIPNGKVGIASDGDHYSDLVEDGWFVGVVPVASMRTMHGVINQLRTMAFESKRRSTLSTVKRTSKHEQILINAVLSRGLPTPNRNYRIDRENGKELTTPDLAWPGLKIAFYVDGLWWHHAKDDTNLIDGLMESDNRDALLETNKTRAENDARIRSRMQADGWTVLVCTDRDLENPVRVEEQVDLIETTISRVMSEREIALALDHKVEDSVHQADIDIANLL